MELKTLKCPNCGATLDIEAGLDTFFCKYCGNRIIIEKSDAAYQAQTAEKRFEHERATQERMYQNEQAEWERQETAKSHEHKRSLTKTTLRYARYLIPLILLLLLCVPALINNSKKISEMNNTCVEIEEAIKEGDYDYALLLTNRLHLEGFGSSEDERRNWDARREEYIRQIRLAQSKGEEKRILNPPISSDDCSKSEKSEVYDLFFYAGFKNIYTKPVEGSENLFSKKGKIKRVTIDGKTTFSKKDSFSDDVDVVIYYYEESGFLG